ncbi:MAG: hypothetical protein QOH12_2403 [Solirubrobacteraceae bacterium]|jgi:hypothetical protein|nr:hypothetical protein [Solirubrobacteraceae bacterium]
MPDFPPIDLARLAHAQAARELSDTARGEVSTRADEEAEEGDFIARALRLVHEADRVLELAVVLERERGSSWEAVGRALGQITRQSAHGRYAAAHHEFLDALMFPVRREADRAYGRSVLPDGLEDPRHTASRLDVWAIRHREPQEPGAEQIAPVSAGLSRNGLHNSETNLLGRMGAIVGGGDLPAGVDGETAARMLAERRAARYRLVLEADPTDVETREALTRAEAELDRGD